jgi:competence protein ComEA
MLDVNSADAMAIAAALDGVGLTKAQEIVAYREMFGNFHSVEELADVKGIGPATVEKNRQRIIVVNK